jgi:hypothetical protein
MKGFCYHRARWLGYLLCMLRGFHMGTMGIDCDLCGEIKPSFRKSGR